MKLNVLSYSKKIILLSCNKLFYDYRIIGKAKNFILMKLKRFFLFLVAFILITINPAHAYAGPGAAIGAIIVALTVILAFGASLLLSIFELLRKFFKAIKLKFSKINKKSKSNKKTKLIKK